MNEEIKEILDRFNKVKSASNKLSYYPEDLLNRKDMWLLLDYITYLQEENEKLEKLNEANYLSFIDVNARNIKAVEYIKENEISCYYTENGKIISVSQELLSILRGNDE